jgi:hypothetical protein
MKRILSIIFTVGFILSLSVYAFAGRYLINGTAQGSYSSMTIDQNGTLNIVEEQSSPIPPDYLPDPISTGSTGSLTNPIKINKWSSKGFYIPSSSPDNSRGSTVIPPYTKCYFEVDPIATTLRSVASFLFEAKFFSGGGTVCKMTQNKITGVYSPEICYGSTLFADSVFGNGPYDIDSTRFFYAIDDSGCNFAVTDEIWFQAYE